MRWGLGYPHHRDGRDSGALCLMQLLLIEDDRDAAGYLVKALTEAGYRVYHAADGRDGLFQATDRKSVV